MRRFGDGEEEASELRSDWQAEACPTKESNWARRRINELQVGFRRETFGEKKHGLLPKREEAKGKENAEKSGRSVHCLAGNFFSRAPTNS